MDRGFLISTLSDLWLKLSRIILSGMSGKKTVSGGASVDVLEDSSDGDPPLPSDEDESDDPPIPSSGSYNSQSEIYFYFYFN